MKKLTLSADEEVVALAREIADRDGTSISAMFSGYIRALARQGRRKAKLAPITRRLAGILRVPSDFDEKEELAQALAEKYGIEL